MQETKVIVKSEDRSSVVAAFFLGVATTLFMVLYWISFPNILVLSFISLITLIIFLAIAILLAHSGSTKKIVRVKTEEKPKEPKEPEEIPLAKSLPTSLSLKKDISKEIPSKKPKIKPKKSKAK